MILSCQVRHLRNTVSINKKWYGNKYGGFYVCPDIINDNSIVYSFGIGEDISFDIKMIDEHKCDVFAFDPTPKSVKWVKQYKSMPSKFNFFDYGLADRSGPFDFFLPKNTEYVSGSFVIQDCVDATNRVQVEMKSFKDIIKILGHNKVDVLKMDIEGAEYKVLDSILSSPILINQILIEFHDRLFIDGKCKTIDAIKRLNNCGYEIFGVSDSFQEVSFINKRFID